MIFAFAAFLKNRYLKEHGWMLQTVKGVKEQNSRTDLCGYIINEKFRRIKIQRKNFGEKTFGLIFEISDKKLSDAFFM